MHIPSKLVSLLIAACAVAPSCFAQSAEGPTQRYSLDGTWQFALAPHAADADALAGFYKPGFKLSAFRPTPVPSNWAIEGFEEPVYKPFKSEASEGFYTRSFTPPSGWKGTRTVLHFGGVWSSAEVWLNGTNLGRHDSGFTSFGMDVTKFLLYGQENRLSVRVRQQTHDYLLDTNDDWSLGGIYRDVWLESMPLNRWVDYVETRTTFDTFFQDADLQIRALVNDSRTWPRKADPPTDYAMRFRLTAPDGSIVQERTVSIALHAGNGRDVPVTMHVPTPLHWTAETPALYILRVELLEEGKVAHWRSMSVGFRQIAWTNGVYRINGQAVKLKGVDRHDEYPDVGRATRPQDWLKDIQMMQAANINFIRTSHYPPAEGFLDLCDRMGMYVEDEIPMGFGGDHAEDPSLIAGTALRVFETLRRDRNHPSIVVWSVGNEDPITTLHIEAMRTVHGIDPTRPVLMPQQRGDFTPPEADMLAPHYGTPFNYDELGAHATRPILATEHTHAFGVDGVDGFGGFEDRWYELMHHPTAAGGAIWMWADQGLLLKRKTATGGEEKKMQLNMDGVDGIVNSDRTPQRDYWETRAVYAPVYPRIGSLHFTLGDAAARIPIQNDYDFTNLKEIRTHWQLMEDDRQLSAGELALDQIPHAAAWVDLPLTALKTPHAGATYYVLFTFNRADGSEITRRSVELLPNPSSMPVPAPLAAPLSVDESDATVVHAGDISFRFDPATARLLSASLKGVELVHPAELSVWRPMNIMEIIVMKAKTDPNSLPDLNKYKVSVRDWKVDRTPTLVHITATAEYVVNPKNRFTVAYTYDVRPEASLTVQYSILPTVEATFFPKIEIALPLAAGLSQMRWLGLGPIDTYPNEHAAGIFGVWSAAAGTADAAGVKTTRWAEFTSLQPQSPAVRIENIPYVQFEAGTLHALSGLEGRYMKNRRPEKPEERLDILPGGTFHGAFTLRLIPGDQAH